MIKTIAFSAGMLIAAAAVAQEVRDTPKGHLNLSVVGQQCSVYQHTASDFKFGVSNLNGGMASVIASLETDGRLVSIRYQTNTSTPCDGDSQVVPIIYVTPKH